MKRSQMGLFYKAITIVSFFSIVCVGSDLHAVTLGSGTAKQIGFRVTNSGSNAGAPAAAPSANQYGSGQKVFDQAPVVIQGRGGNPAAAPARAPSSAAPNMAMEPVVEGFGDKVPLTVAVQQILPAGYGYTLGDGVDAGQLVSWRGGRPWSVVLQDMLSQASLSYSVNGSSVAINSLGVAPTIVTGIPVAPIAPPVTPMTQVPQAIVQPAPQPVMVQQPVVMDQQPVVVQQPQVVMQPQQQVVMQQPVMVQQPQMIMQPQPQVVMQPQQQVVMQQPVMVQQPQVVMQPQPMMVDPQQQVVVQQPVAIPQPVPQVQAAAAPQPLQIENPLLFQSQTWEARPGQTLRGLLQEWCTRVGAELNWTAEFDYPIMASMNMTGTFEEAVRVLLTGFDGAKPTPRGRLHYNPAAGQSILIVEADGNHYGD